MLRLNWVSGICFPHSIYIIRIVFDDDAHENHFTLNLIFSRLCCYSVRSINFFWTAGTTHCSSVYFLLFYFGYKMWLHPILLKCDAIMEVTTSNCTLNQLSLTLFLSLFRSFNTYCLVIFLPFRIRSTFANIETLTQILLSARSSNTTTKFNVILCDWHSSWHNSVYTINLLSRCRVWMHFMFLMLIFLMLMLLLYTWYSSDLMLQYNSFMLIEVYLGRDTISFPLVFFYPNSMCMYICFVLCQFDFLFRFSYFLCSFLGTTI